MRLFAAPRSLATWLHIATFAGVLLLAALLVPIQQLWSSQMEQARIDRLASAVDAGFSLADHYQKEEAAGHMTRQEAQAAAAAAIGSLRFGGDGDLWIQDQARVIMHPMKPELNGQPNEAVRDADGNPFFVMIARLMAQQDEAVIRDNWRRAGSQTAAPKLSVAKAYRQWGWIIAAGAYTDDLVAMRQRLTLLLAAIGVGVALLLGGSLWLIGRRVTRPTLMLAEAAKDLAAGDLSVSIPDRTRRDEIGVLASALSLLRDAEDDRRMLEQKTAREAEAKTRRQAAVMAHAEDFSTVVVAVMAQLALSAEQLHGASGAMVEAVGRTEKRAADTATGARESSTNLTSVVLAAEEMSASIREISEQVSAIIGAVRDVAHRASETDRKVLELSAESDQIGKVVGLISAIAAQTSLLALNATIEAARAGEAGKGFAVVANEVKALATQTARATDDIRARVAAIGGVTSEAVGMVAGVRRSVEDMERVVGAIAAAIEQQTAATREIAANAGTVSLSTEGAVTAMEDVCRVVSEAMEASRSVVASAVYVNGTSDKLRAEMQQFLSAMLNAGDEERRLYERLPGDGMTVKLRSGPHEGQDVPVVDISRGGACLGCDWKATLGDEVLVELRPSAPPVEARIVRAGNGQVALYFMQTAEGLRVVDAVVQQHRQKIGALAA